MNSRARRRRTYGGNATMRYLRKLSRKDRIATLAAMADDAVKQLSIYDDIWVWSPGRMMDDNPPFDPLTAAIGREKRKA